MFQTWGHSNLKSFYNEVFGEPVDHPLIIRILAFILDYGIISIISLLTVVIPNAFGLETSQYIFWVHLLFCIFYFTLTNSKLTKGQTFGKMLFQIRVIDKEGNYLALGKSFIRCLPIIFVTNGLGIIYQVYLLSEDDRSPLFIWSVTFIMTLLIGELYFPILKLNRQALHDLLVGSHVIPKSRMVNLEDGANMFIASGYIVIVAITLFYYYRFIS
jgi:uncharacterized RDD family membrane protein YckC